MFKEDAVQLRTAVRAIQSLHFVSDEDVGERKKRSNQMFHSVMCWWAKVFQRKQRKTNHFHAAVNMNDKTSQCT